MFQKTLTVARKYGSKAAAAPLALFVAGSAMAQDATPAAATIKAQVEQSLGTGAEIATAVVIGLFVIFGIKLLWRSK